MTIMNFNVNYNFETLNEAVEQLPYARVYQSPVDHENVFNIDVTDKNGGDYNSLKQLVALAEKDGYKYDKYFEHMGLFGDYHYTAVMYVEDGKTVSCSYDQTRVYVSD